MLAAALGPLVGGVDMSGSVLLGYGVHATPSVLASQPSADIELSPIHVSELDTSTLTGPRGWLIGVFIVALAVGTIVTVVVLLRQSSRQRQRRHPQPPLWGFTRTFCCLRVRPKPICARSCCHIASVVFMLSPQ